MALLIGSSESHWWIILNHHKIPRKNRPQLGWYIPFSNTATWFQHVLAAGCPKNPTPPTSRHLLPRLKPGVWRLPSWQNLGSFWAILLGENGGFLQYFSSLGKTWGEIHGNWLKLLDMTSFINAFCLWWWPGGWIRWGIVRTWGAI